MGWVAPVAWAEDEDPKVLLALPALFAEDAENTLAAIKLAVGLYKSRVAAGEHKPHPEKSKAAELRRLHDALEEVSAAAKGLHPETLGALFEWAPIRGCEVAEDAAPSLSTHRRVRLHERLNGFVNTADLLRGRVIAGQRELKSSLAARGGRPTNEAAELLAFALGELWHERTDRVPTRSEQKEPGFLDLLRVVFELGGVDANPEHCAKSIVAFWPAVQAIKRLPEETEPE